MSDSGILPCGPDLTLNKQMNKTLLDAQAEGWMEKHSSRGNLGWSREEKSAQRQESCDPDLKQTVLNFQQD